MKKLNRRNFLSHSALSAAGLLLPLGCATSGLLRRPSSSGESIAIIGAGMAGISAGRLLQDSGRCRVTIFEARDRIGGRVNTRQTQVGNLEYGASWIHAPRGNSLTTLCSKYGISHIGTDRPKNDVAYLANGQRLSKQDYNRLYDEFSELCSKLNRIGAASPTPLSMGELFDKHVPPKKREIFLHFLRGTNELTYGADLNVLSAESFDLGVETSGGGNHIIPSGYSGLIHRHAENLKIELEAEITGIEHGNSGVTLYFKNGSRASFDRCVVTVPLGVLKNKKIAFDPILPLEKREAIERIGFGHFTKLFITFPLSFWPAKASWIDLIGSDPERVIGFFNLEPFTGSPTIICMAGGAQGLRWQKEGKEKAVTKALDQLTTIFGKIPEPVFTDVTTWGVDSFSGGSYSFIAKGSKSADMKSLGDAVNGRLFFAGEACVSTEHYATVHGAHDSGRETAEQILKILA